MTSRSLDLHQTSISSRSFAVSSIDSFASTRAASVPPVDLRFESSYKSSIEALHKLLKRLAGMELPGKEHVEAYLRYVCRRNRRPRTLASLYTNIVLFLGMIKDNGKTCIEEITKKDVEAFIEHEQDRGIIITTIRTKLVCVRAFLRYLVEEEIVLPDVLGRRIRLQLPDRLGKTSSEWLKVSATGVETDMSTGVSTDASGGASSDIGIACFMGTVFFFFIRFLLFNNSGRVLLACTL